MIEIDSSSQTPQRPAGYAGLPEWSLVAAVNDDNVLESTLLASPAIAHHCQWIAKRGFVSAGQAYNAGLDEASNDIVVFAHQDVFLPEAWLAGLGNALRQLAITDPQWAVLGSFGVTRSRPPEMRGYCYSTGLRRMLGAPFASPLPARTLDEFVLVVRKSSGLRFDERLPGFHLYGADICLQAEDRHLGSYILSAFCIHNANGIDRLPHEFWRSYLYLRRKWWRRLPVKTCCTTLTKGCLPIVRRLAGEMKNGRRPHATGHRSANVTALYDQLSQSDARILRAPFAL